MKYLTYILRNARRNPVRSILTIASMSICLSLMMILLSFFAISDEANSSTRILQPDCVAQCQRLRRRAADHARQRDCSARWGHRGDVRLAGSAANIKTK